MKALSKVRENDKKREGHPEWAKHIKAGKFTQKWPGGTGLSYSNFSLHSGYISQVYLEPGLRITEFKGPVIFYDHTSKRFDKHSGLDPIIQMLEFDSGAVEFIEWWTR